MKANVRNLIISVLSLTVIGTIADITFGTRPFFCSILPINRHLGEWINRETYLEKLNSGRITLALVYEDIGWVRMMEQDRYSLELASTVDESFLKNLKAKVRSESPTAVSPAWLEGIDAWCIPPQVND